LFLFTQGDLKDAIRAYTAASILVAKLGVFSANETKEDIGTGSLKYLLLDAFLSELHARANGTAGGRLQTLQTAEGYLKTFLAKLDRYELLRDTDKVLLEQYENGLRHDAAKQREYKIAMFKREKEAKARLKALEDTLHERRSKGIVSVANGSSTSSGKAAGDEDEDEDDSFEDDEESAREHTLALIESFTLVAFTQLELVQQETQMLEHVAKNGPPPKLEPVVSPTQPPPAGSLKPIVIKDTRSIMQQQVFQPGWRQPTMTLDEFVDLERKRGNMLTGGGPAQEARMEREKEEKALRDSDADADEATYKAREWDEYTDDHRRGDGNRYNRS